MTPNEFRQYWTTVYPQCPPVAYRLRQAYAARWVRFHTLPESKRYAETEEEYQEILRRHNILLTEVLGDGQPVVLVTTGYSETARPVCPQAEVLERYPESHHVLSLPMNNDLGDDDTPMYWHTFIGTLVWMAGLADPLVRQVADDTVRNVLFVSTEHQRVYAPYDGGADIILPSATERDALRRRHSEWLSVHPLGL